MNNHGTSESRFYVGIPFENEKNREWNGRQKKSIIVLGTKSHYFFFIKMKPFFLKVWLMSCGVPDIRCRETSGVFGILKTTV